MDSAPGRGSTFEVYLPKHGEGNSYQDNSPSRDNHLKGDETILLVEDEKPILEMIERILTRLGYTVLAADTPDKALQISKRADLHIHLLMTDVVMPDMNGRDLADRILESRPDTRCLFMSGYAASVIAHRGILDQDVNFISKPFSKQMLSVKLREVLGT